MRPTHRGDRRDHCTGMHRIVVVLLVGEAPGLPLSLFMAQEFDVLPYEEHASPSKKGPHGQRVTPGGEQTCGWNVADYD